MKIALVCPYDMLLRTGGVQQLVVHLHDGLVKKGHTVKIITPRPPGFKGEPPKDYILMGATTNFNAGFGAAGNWGLPLDRKEVAKILKREKFDVINFHEPWAPLLAWYMIKESKAVHVGTFHANLMDRPSTSTWVGIFTPYARNMGKKLHMITAVSPAPVDLMIKKANTPLERKIIANIRYIPNGIDLKLFRPPKKRQPINGPGTKTILYTGRLDRRKGVEWLLRALAVVVEENPAVHLVIAGKGPQRSRLEDLVEEFELTKNVKFAGYVSEEEKRHLLGNCDLYCSPALFGESFGIVLIEAMAMGAPIVAGRNSGYIHALKGRGRLGLVDPKNTDDFANLISVFLEDEGLNKMMRDWGLKEVKQYDYPKIVDQYEAAYKQALIYVKKRNGHQFKKANDDKKRGLISRLFVRRHA